MKIKYNEAEKTVEINDDAKSHYFMGVFSFVVTLFLVFVNLLDVNETGIRFTDGIFIAIGIISVILFYLQFYKKSTSNIIPVDNITQFNEKLFFGSKWFSLQLSNGKKRDLGKFKTTAEINDLKIIFSEIGILN